MLQQLGVQLYSVRHFIKTPQDADLTFQKLAEMGYTEVQTAGHEFDAELFAALLQKHGLRVIGTHTKFPKMQENPQETLRVNKLWNSTNIGIGSMPPEYRTDLKAVKCFISECNRLAKFFFEHGCRLTYHNHNFEFCRIDGYKTVMDVLYEELDPNTTSFVLDTCWVAAAGADVCAWLKKLSGRIDILHLKDMTLQKENETYLPQITEVGNGNLYWDGILQTARDINVRHYIVEHDNHWIDGDPFKSLQQSADFLQKYRMIK